VKSVEMKESKRGRPEGLNTVELLKHSSTHMGLGPLDAIRTAERLYLSGYITYPRTESTQYATNFDFVSIIKALEKSTDDAAIKEYCPKLLSGGMNLHKKGVDVGDHPPITPTTKVPQGLGSLDASMYDFVCRHFLASISQDAVLENTTVIFEFGTFQAKLKGLFVRSEGFMQMANWSKTEAKYIDKVEKGATAILSTVLIDESTRQLT
jgi:DNA topoisomerase-3